MIRLRLQRRGRKKRPYFHIVAADQRSPRDGRVIERLGRYDNVSEKKQLTLDEERIIHWLRVGAQPSDTVRSLLKGEGILYKLHLIRWGKSEDEIEQALAEWRDARESKTDTDEEQVSRKKREKALLDAEEKEFKRQLEEKAAEAARQAKIKEAEKEVAAAEDEAVVESSEETAGDDAEEQKEARAEETAEEEAVADVAEEEPKEEASEEEPKAETAKPKEVAKEELQASEPEEVKSEEPSKLSTDMNANEAIDHIKNTPLDQLKGFVPDDEDRVTVQRAWESKQSE